jgi:hypothetical protein
VAACSESRIGGTFRVKIFFDQQRIEELHDLPRLYPSDEFASPTRSTVPLLSLVLHGTETWRQILREVGMPERETAVHLEYKVRSPAGRGNASHTDAMLIAGSQACAIEAKWTEPAYATVRDWLGADASLNRQAFLNGWLSLLQPHATREMSLSSVANLTYQTLHRAASACAAGGKPTLAYLAFTPGPHGGPAESSHLRDSLEQLAAALGSGASLSLWLIEVETRPTAAFEQISRLPKGDPLTGAEVRAALQGSPLFEFIGCHLHRYSEHTIT